MPLRSPYPHPTVLCLALLSACTNEPEAAASPASDPAERPPAAAPAAPSVTGAAGPEQRERGEGPYASASSDIQPTVRNTNDRAIVPDLYPGSCGRRQGPVVRPRACPCRSGSARGSRHALSVPRRRECIGRKSDRLANAHSHQVVHGRVTVSLEAHDIVRLAHCLERGGVLLLLLRKPALARQPLAPAQALHAA